MRRLTWVFAGRTSLIVGFVMSWLSESAQDKTYNKTCVTSKDRSACISIQYYNGSRLSFFRRPGCCRRYMRSAKTLIRLHRCAGWSEFALIASLIVGFVVRWLIYDFLVAFTHTKPLLIKEYSKRKELSFPLEKNPFSGGDANNLKV